MTDRLIRIKQYEQAADDKVSIGGIKWLRKWDVCIQCDSAEEAKALRAALAQPEPVAWIDTSGHPKHLKHLQSASERKLYGELQPLYTAPPQREWQGLTDEEIEDACWTEVDQRLRSFTRAIEAKLKEKNT